MIQSQFKSNIKDHDYILNKSEVQACRLCLDTGPALFSISEHNLVDSIKLLTGLTVTAQDEQPQYICNCCKYLLKKFIKFRKRCHNAHDALTRITLMEIEITTDVIRTIDRKSLNLTLSMDRADEFIDCLNKDYVETAVVKQENDTEHFNDPLESHYEIRSPDDKTELPQYEILVLDDQSKLPKDESNNSFKIVIDKISSKADPLQLETTSNIKTLAHNLNGKADISLATVYNDVECNTVLGDQDKRNKDNEFKVMYDPYVKEFNITYDTYECGLNVDEIISITNEDDESQMNDSESEEEQEVLPEIKISKETNVNLEIKLSMQNKKLLEKFFYKQFKYRKLLNEEKVCQLERVRKVLEYNGNDFTKQYDEEELGMGGNKRKLNADFYIWVSTEKKRAEFEEKFNIKVKVLTKEQQIEEFKARAVSVNYNRKLFKCGICYIGFMVEKLYITHLAVHNPNRGKYECSICHYRFTGLFKYRVHILTHRSKFFCKECKYTTNSFSAAKAHHDWHKGYRFKCKYCSIILNAKSTYFAHMKLRHASELVPCDVCGETFSGSNGLSNHMSRTHEVVGVRSNSSKCITCKMRFNSVKALNNHLGGGQDGVCNPKMKYCLECGENFENDELLEEHSVVHAKTFACELCGMLFVNQTSLNIHHQRKHLNITKNVYKKRKSHVKYTRKKVLSIEAKERLKAICEYCGKTLSNKYLLTEHINVHLGLKPFKCNLCSKSFSKKLSLKLHIAVHTGERPFTCEVCGTSFQNAGNLKRHKDVVHTGIKRFQCDICNKKFGCKGSVSLHVRTVHMKLPHPPRKKRNRAGAVKRRKLASYSTSTLSDE